MAILFLMPGKIGAGAAEISEWVADRMKLARRYGGLVLGTNCIPPACPFENLLEFNLAAEELGRS